MGSGFRIREQRRRGGERLWPSHPETWRNGMCNVIDKHARDFTVHVNIVASSLGECDVKTDSNIRSHMFTFVTKW